MILRADHVAGGAFIALGVLVLRRQRRSAVRHVHSPGAGMMPKLMAALMMAVRALIMVARAARARRSRRSTGATVACRAAACVITAAAVASYQPLGFLITMALLVFALLVVVERRSVLPRRRLQHRAHRCLPIGCSARR